MLTGWLVLILVSPNQRPVLLSTNHNPGFGKLAVKTAANGLRCEIAANCPLPVPWFVPEQG